MSDPAIEAAQAALLSARAELESRREQIQSNQATEQKAIEIQGGQQALRSQTLLQRQNIQRQLNANQEAINSQGEALNQFETEQLSPVESRLEGIKQAQADYNKAYRVFSDNDSYGIFGLTPAQRKIYGELKAGEHDAINANIADLKKQGVDVSTLQKIKDELTTNLGKIPNAELNERVNVILNPIFSGGEISNVGEIPAAPFKAPSFERLPTTGERIRSTASRYGINIPSGTSAFNQLFRGTEQGTLQDINPLGIQDIITPLAYIPERLGNIAGEGISNGLNKVGYKGFDMVIPKQLISNKGTIGSEFIIPEKTIKALNPQELGFLTSQAVSLPVYAGEDILTAGVGVPASFIAKGISTLRTPEAYIPSNTNRFDRDLGAAFDIGIGSLGLGAVAMTPTIKIPETKPTELYNIDVIKPIMKNGKQVDVSSYGLLGITPGNSAFINTRLGKLFFSDTEVPLYKQRIDIDTPLYPLLIQNGEIKNTALINSFELGKNKGTISRLRGIQSPEIDIKAFNSLPYEEKIRLQQLAEFKSQGRPASLDRTPQILSKDTKFNLGQLESNKIFKYNLNGKTYLFNEGSIFKKPVVKGFSDLSRLDFEKNGLSADNIPLGFFVNEGGSGLKKGEIYLNDLTPKNNIDFTMRHEVGHYVDELLGLSDRLKGNPDFELAAQQNLNKKYGSIPKIYKGSEINELVADSFAREFKGKTPETIFSRGKATRIQPGKRITRAGSTSTANLMLETPEYKVYKTTTLMKATNNPNYRATKGAVILKGISKVYEPIDLSDNFGETNSISTGGRSGSQQIKKSNSGKTMEILSQAKVIATKNILSAVSKANRLSPELKALISKSEKPSSQISILVGGTSRSLGDFAGKNTYEKTDFGKVNVPTFGTVESTGQIGVPKTITTLGLQSNLKQVQPTDQLTKALIKLGLSNNQIEILKLTSAQKQDQSLRSDQLFKQATEQATKQSSKFMQSQKDITKEINKNPKIKIPIIMTQATKVSPKSLGGLSSEGFDVLVRRYGKDITIGKNLPFGKATKTGAEYDIATLARSFKLKPTGEKTSISDINYKLPGQIFRPSKREAGRIVQKAKFSLSSGTERTEIQSARGKKGRKIKLF